MRRAMASTRSSGAESYATIPRPRPPDPGRLDRQAIERRGRDAGPRASAAGGCSSWASAAAPANASHAVNDFRKICGIEAYAPDRQRVRADGARQRRRLGDAYSRRGCAAAASRRDSVMVFSVGGGDLERNVSPNLVRALELRAGGRAPRSAASWAATAATPPELADACVIVPAARPRQRHARTPRPSRR